MKAQHLLLFLLLPIAAVSQVRIEGSVRYLESKAPVEFCNVLYGRVGSEAILGFTQTDLDGIFRFEYRGDLDSLKVKIMGLSVETQQKNISATSQQLHFFALPKVTAIREVEVKADAIERRSDTLSYNVGSFIEPTDRVIGDVLKKLPGIEVSSSGKISYNGKAINKFYVEGLDMLGGRYSLATNNVAAKDIASVQIYENHQPVKALKDIQFSESAAVNLTLKESVRGSFASNVMGGLGYEPFQWTAELIGMLFSRSFQTLNLYKSNATGDNIGRELTSFYDNNSFVPLYSPLRVVGTQAPPLETDRYLNNNTHMVTGNAIRRLGEDGEIKLNLSFLNDFQRSRGESQTTYLLPMDSLLYIDEKTEQTLNTNQVQGEAEYMLNNEALFLRNILTFQSSWTQTHSDLLNNGESIRQHLTEQSTSINDQFYSIVHAGDFMFTAKSINRYEYQPSSLLVDPFLYPSLLGQDSEETVLQSYHAGKFSSNTEVSAGYKHNYRHGLFSHTYRLGYNYQRYDLASDLQWAPESAGVVLDSFRNAQNSAKFALYVSPDLSLTHGRLKIQGSLPLSFRKIRMPSFSDGKNRNQSDLLFEPSLSLSYALTPMLKLSAATNYQCPDHGWYDYYPHYVLNNYRFISRRNGDFSDDRHWSNSLSLSYGNALRALFLSATVSYWQRQSSLMYSLSFSDNLATYLSHPMANTADGIRVQSEFSKRIEAIRTTFVLYFQFFKSRGEVWRQSHVFTQENTSYNGTFGINKRFGRITLVYKINYGFSQNYSPSDQQQLPNLQQLRQNAEINATITPAIALRLFGEHYFNDAIHQGSKNLFFGDVECIFKRPRFEYRLTLQNLFNTRLYQNISQGDLIDYRYATTLRPRSILVSVRMSLN